jgi:hypothetical protein
MLAAYLAMRIEAGKLDYVAVFSIAAYKQFQEDVNAILVADGHQDLIVG